MKLKIECWNQFEDIPPKTYEYELDQELNFLKKCLVREQKKGFWRFYPGHIMLNCIVIDDCVEWLFWRKKPIYLCQMMNGNMKVYSIER